MPGVTVRDATGDDLPVILALLDQLREGSSQADRPSEELGERHHVALTSISNSPDLWLLVAEVEGQVVGTCGLAFIPNISHGGRPWCVLENMVVDESQRGSGAGTALVEHALALARERDCYKLSLTSNHKRAAAHSFYESRGFTQTHKGFTIYLD
jgi:N-acetylglutamate synthase-like GNAT family acetyltransferase